MTQPDSTEVERKGTGTPIWVKALLGVSLAANLAVVGVVVGAGLREGADRRADPPKAVKGVVADGGMGPFMDALPREMRREIGDILRDRAEGLVPNRTALVAEFDAMLDIMKTEPFDRARLEAVLDTQRERVTERVMAGRTVVLDQIEAMSPSERAAFVERLEASLARAVEDARRSPPERRDD